MSCKGTETSWKAALPWCQLEGFAHLLGVSGVGYLSYLAIAATGFLLKPPDGGGGACMWGVRG